MPEFALEAAEEDHQVNDRRGTQAGQREHRDEGRTLRAHLILGVTIMMASAAT